MTDFDMRIEQKLDKIDDAVCQINSNLATLTANHERDHQQIAVNMRKQEAHEERLDDVEKKFAKIEGQVFLMKLVCAIATGAGTLGIFLWSIWG